MDQIYQPAQDQAPESNPEKPRSENYTQTKLIAVKYDKKFPYDYYLAHH